MQPSIEALRKLEEMNRFTVYNHIKLKILEQNHAVFSLQIEPNSTNAYGMVHGGALYTLADSATGFAAHSDGRNYVTQGGSLHFLRNQGSGEILAEAKVRHRGRSTCLIDVDIRGDQGKLLATGEFTYFCVDLDTMKEKKEAAQKELEKG